MYYYYDETLTKITKVLDHHDLVSLCFFDERNIPQENCKLLNGQLYDKTTPEYTKAKVIQDGLDEYAQALEDGFLFDGEVFAVDQPSVIQYTMLAVKLNTNAKEPVKVRNKNNDYLSMSAVKYLEFCDKIGTYSEMIENRRIDKVGF